jgi:hypothetical protein
MNKFTTVAMALSALAVVLAYRPERKPGNLTPIQVISAIGACALLLANGAAMAIAIRDGSAILLCTAAATLAITLITFVHGDEMSMSDCQTPESLRPVVDEFTQLLDGSSRLGIDSLETVVAAGRGPAIGVSVRRQGRVVVRVRRDLAAWLEGHQRGGGAGVALLASFVRFIVLHELAHVLNGDHRTFRFMRSVLIAHLVWIAGALAAVTSLAVNRGASATPLLVAVSIVLLWVAQSLVARRFIGERERLADWRAMQTLAPADAARLLERRGRRRAVLNPTALEKLMIDLKAQAPAGVRPNALSRLILLVWPEGDRIHQRSETAAGARAEGRPRPVLWAGLMGMQCGSFAMSLALAAMLAAEPWTGWRHDLSDSVMIAIIMGVALSGATFCEMRVDPARVSVRTIKLNRLRFVVGMVFFLTFALAALVLYQFHARFEVASVPRGGDFAALLMFVALMAGLSAMFSSFIDGRDGGGELRDTPRWPWVWNYPVYMAFVLVLLPLSIGASYWFGIGSFMSGHWFVLTAMSAGGWVVSTSMARSTNATLRAMAPMALLATASPVYGFRIFWRNFYIDVSRTSLARAAAIATVAQMVTMPFFVIPIGLLMGRVRAVLSADATYDVMFWGSFAVLAFVLIIPDRYPVFGGSWMRLLDTSRLQLFEKLLSAARTASPPAAHWLQNALAHWLRDEHFPDALLPRPWCVWTLAPLLSLVRLVHETGETAVLQRWRGRIESSLRQIVSDDAVAVAPGQPPSLHWTTLAVTLIDEAALRGAFPFDRMLDRVVNLLYERLESGIGNLLSDVIAACWLLRRHGRPIPDAQSLRRFARSSSIVSRPLLRQSLTELCQFARLTGDSELSTRLGPIVRSRTWETLQLNPRKDVVLLLDCYLAAGCLGETDPGHAAAAVLVGEVSQRVAEELMAVVRG